MRVTYITLPTDQGPVEVPVYSLPASPDPVEED